MIPDTVRQTAFGSGKKVQCKRCRKDFLLEHMPSQRFKDGTVTHRQTCKDCYGKAISAGRRRGGRSDLRDIARLFAQGAKVSQKALESPDKSTIRQMHEINAAIFQRMLAVKVLS